MIRRALTFDLNMKTMFAITHINKDGMRQLSFANQGRNHYSTEAEAQQKLVAILTNNSVKVLKQYYGDPLTLEVRPVECHPSGDAVGIYFDDPNAPFDKKMKAMGL